MTVRALPEELGAPVAAAHADVRVEVEDGVLGELAYRSTSDCRVMQLSERPPDRLMDAERVGILHERGELQVERFLRMAARRQMA